MAGWFSQQLFVCLPLSMALGLAPARCKKCTQGSVGLRGLLSVSGLVASWVLWLLVGFSFGCGHVAPSWEMQGH